MSAGGWIADLMGYKDAYDASAVRYPRRSAFRFPSRSVSDNVVLGTTDIGVIPGYSPVDLIGLNSNRPATTLIAAPGFSGMLIIWSYVSTQIAGTLGSMTINVTYTDRSGTPTTFDMIDFGTISGSPKGFPGATLIETNGLVPVQWSVSGITTPGPLSYSLRMFAQLI